MNVSRRTFIDDTSFMILLFTNDLRNLVAMKADLANPEKGKVPRFLQLFIRKTFNYY